MLKISFPSKFPSFFFFKKTSCLSIFKFKYMLIVMNVLPPTFKYVDEWYAYLINLINIYYFKHLFCITPGFVLHALSLPLQLTVKWLKIESWNSTRYSDFLIASMVLTQQHQPPVFQTLEHYLKMFFYPRFSIRCTI